MCYLGREKNQQTIKLPYHQHHRHQKQQQYNTEAYRDSYLTGVVWESHLPHICQMILVFIKVKGNIILSEKKVHRQHLIR